MDSAAIQQDQSTDDLNIEVVSEGEAYIDMVRCSIGMYGNTSNTINDTVHKFHGSLDLGKLLCFCFCHYQLPVYSK